MESHRWTLLAKALAVALGMAILLPGPAQAASAADEARRALAGFEEFAQRAVADWNVPGAALAVVRGGEVVLAAGFGRRDLERDLPMTADTLFAIGSSTKAFTTTLLAMLVDEGDLAWDAPLRTYLPAFRLRDPLTTELITPRDLVTHRSGLPRHDLVWYNNNRLTRAQLVARLAHLEANQPLRARYQYNNLMFLTAGHLAERLTGASWEEALRGRLLEPLGMRRTNFSVDDSQADEDFSQPYREDEEQRIEKIPFRRIDLIGPAGSLNSSVAEMSRWLLFNLAGGRIGERRLLNAATLAALHSPHMPTGETAERREISQASYGMGWLIDTYRGRRRVHHGGGIDGFSTRVVFFPDDDLGAVAFTNRNSQLPEILIRHAADRLLGLEPIDWNSEGLEERRAGLEATEEARGKKATMRRPGTAPSRPAAEFAGSYWHPGYGGLEIEPAGSAAAGESIAGDKGAAALRLRYNGIEAPLEHWHYDVWRGAETDGDPTFEDVRFQFRANANGDVASVEAPLEPQVDPIVFRRQPAARLSDPGFLARLTGRYEVAGQPVVVELGGTTLTVILPGQPLYTLRPALGDRFELVEFPVVEVGFEVDLEPGAAGPAAAVTFYQPNGVFTARRVE